MKRRSSILIVFILVFWSCSSVKKLEATAPFDLGEPYAQKWVVAEVPKKSGYEVVIPVLSLDNEKAILKNLYHKGKMTRLEIKLTEKGNVAVAEYGSETKENDRAGMLPTQVDEGPFPFDLTETQAVISFVNNEKVKYYLINGIRQHLPITYATVSEKMQR